eukprot:Skav211714  [mRNA]  locus=scaffold2852:347117:355745:- [translate_table: standard]
MIRRCLLLAVSLVSAQEEEACDLQLLQVSQSLESTSRWQLVVDFANALGKAQADAILTPAVASTAALMELASDVASAAPMSLQKSRVEAEAKATTSSTTVAVIAAAVPWYADDQQGWAGGHPGIHGFQLPRMQTFLDH